jgi:uracil-DNA glycosylase
VLIIVGQAPSKSGDGNKPFSESKRSAKRLAVLLGISSKELGERFCLVNVFDRWPGKAGKGDAFPVSKARKIVAKMRFEESDLVFLAGKNVAKAFGFSRAEYFEELSLDGARAFVIPHPSGINRWWNDAENTKKASIFMRRKVFDEEISKSDGIDF